MRLLKAFLYVVLISCIMWGFVIVFGPKLIRVTSKALLGDGVILQNVRVSPTLDVSIGSISYFAQGNYFNKNIKNAKEEKIINYSRAVSIKWSILRNVPLLTVSVGPTSIENFVSFDKASVVLPKQGFARLLRPDIKVAFRNLTLPMTASGESFEFEGSLNTDAKTLENINFAINRLTFFSNPTVNVNQANGTLDQINLTQSFTNQSNNLSINVDSLSAKDPKIQVSGITSIIENFKGIITFKGNAAKLNQGGELLAVKDFAYMGSVDAFQMIPKGPLYFSARHVNLIRPNMLIDGVDIEYSRGKDGNKINAIGRLNRYDVSFDDNFVGTLNDSNLKVLMNYNMSYGKLSVDWTSELTQEFNSNVDLSSLGSAIINIPDSVLNCGQTSCGLESLRAEFELSLKNEQLMGFYKCKKADCKKQTGGYELETTNTEKLFQSLLELKQFNPLFLLTLFSTLRLGEKVGNGHKIYDRLN